MMSILDYLDGILYYPILVVVLTAAGLYFTCRTGLVQFRMFWESIRLVMEKPQNEGAVSPFHALMVSTASRVGTGNILGVSTAICLGGPGSVFWMWVIAVIGGASAFIESTLAQVYKRRDSKGDSYGGPAYYIESAMHNRTLGVLFAFFLIITYAGGFNMLASYNLQSTFAAYSWYDPAVTPWIIGAVLGALVGYCIMGGGRRILRVTGVLVPIMGLIYVAAAVIVVVMHINLIPQVFGMIFADAFDFRSILGGVSGSCLMFGVKRGLFSNEAGVGSAPNAAASADVSHPVKQGLVQMLSVFIDTLLICSATAFMILCSGIDSSAFIDEAGNTMNGAYIQASLDSNFGVFGGYFITAALALFAFTTLVGNYFYAEMNISYLYKNALDNKPFMVMYRLLAVLVIFLGAQFSAGLAWDTADVLMGFMALINVPVCIILGNTAFRALKDYTQKRKAGKPLNFKASDIGVENTEYWK